MTYYSDFYKIEVRDEIAREFTNAGGEVDDMMAGLHEVRVRRAEKKYDLPGMAEALDLACRQTDRSNTFSLL